MEMRSQVPNKRILVAGAGGFVGREVVRLLTQAQHPVATQVVALFHRRPAADEPLAKIADIVVADALHPPSLAALGGPFHAVISCMGASVALRHPDRRGYSQVDTPANNNLLQAVLGPSLRRFVYLSLFVQPGYAHCRYVRAHEDFVDALRKTAVKSCTVRPTGIFSAMDELLTMAKQDKLAVVGDGQAKSNPIDPLDVAQACIDALETDADELACGGPDIFSRREMALLAAQVVGQQEPKIRSLPAGLVALAATCVRPFHPRIGELVEFVGKVAVTDAVAPIVGRRRLVDYFRAQRLKVKA